MHSENPRDALYDWFDRKICEDIDVERSSACHQLVHALGVLSGIGIPRQAIEGFVDRTLGSLDRMLSVVRSESTTGENFAALMSEVSKISEERKNSS